MTQSPGMPAILATVESARYRKLLELARNWFENPDNQKEYERWKEEQK